MRSQYIPVLIQLALAAGFAGSLLVLTHLFGPSRPAAAKLSPFECGVDPVDQAHHRFSVKFYLVAMLFILFDIEAIFFYPWALIFKGAISSGLFLLIEMGTFALVLLAGFFYIWRKGVLEWA
ncbi:NADH-quinone oxidoreductase subunit A [bacterium]|nr:NADH-quinone oxidoreductase subunit A [bacterium]